MFYLLTVILVLYNILLYAIFRGGIYDYLRLSKISRTYIKKNCKGARNYWLYTSIHKKNSLGALYYLNAVFLIYTICFSVVALALGSIESLQPVLLIAATGLLPVQIPSVAVASVYTYRMEFGKPFVLVARRKETGKLCSSLVDIFSWVLTALLLYLSYKQL